MNGIFDFIQDFDNYEDRAVGHFEEDDLIVDTCQCSDGRHPYETAVQHPRYNGNHWVIVEAYDDTTAALFGNGKWIQIMTREKLPDKLVDCKNANISAVVAAFGLEMEFPRQDPMELCAPNNTPDE